MITNYKIITVADRRDDFTVRDDGVSVITERMAAVVLDHIASGWQPLGGPSFDSDLGLCRQAMVKSGGEG